MNKFIKIGEVSKMLGVSIQTLRRWSSSNRIVPDFVSDGDTRYYSLEKINKLVKLGVSKIRHCDFSTETMLLNELRGKLLEAFDILDQLNELDQLKDKDGE